MSPSPIRNTTRCALFAALLCICSWISIPLPNITLTLQTFSVFLALDLLGGKWGTAACLTWLVLGAAGLPVFSGFRGGLGILLGATGGYLWGFLIACLVYWVVTALFGNKTRIFAMVLGQLCCYACGTLWYSFGYLSGTFSILPTLAQCVFPYLIPDALKLFLVHRLSRRLHRVI